MGRNINTKYHKLSLIGFFEFEAGIRVKYIATK